jgi:hypothetical protein
MAFTLGPNSGAGPRHPDFGPELIAVDDDLQSDVVSVGDRPFVPSRSVHILS